MIFDKMDLLKSFAFLNKFSQKNVFLPYFWVKNAEIAGESAGL
jgi:hypothetical protein